MTVKGLTVSLGDRWRRAKRNGIVVHVLANCIGPKPNVFVRWFAKIYGCLAENIGNELFRLKKIASCEIYG